MIRWILYRSLSAVSFILLVLVGLSTIAFADYRVVTRDGKTLKWESFSLEDGSYCTWKNGGKFCLPLGDVVSVNEIASGNEAHEGQASATYRSAPVQRSGEKRGEMTRSFDQGSVDGRSSYVGQGGRRGGSAYQSYDANSSNTTYSSQVDEADIRRMEFEAAAKRIEQDNRRTELERDRQTEIAQQRQREEDARRKREQDREWDRVRIR